MKRTLRFLAALSLLGTTGCISTHLVRDVAQPHEVYQVQEAKWQTEPGKPGYYALLPVTIVADVATSPIQFLLWLARDNDSGSMTVDGIPVPIPPLPR